MCHFPFNIFFNYEINCLYCYKLVNKFFKSLLVILGKSSMFLEDNSWQRGFLRNQSCSSTSCANKLSENSTLNVQCIRKNSYVLKMLGHSRQYS